MSSDDIAIRVSDVSKSYVLFDRPEDRLKQMVIPRLERIAGLAPRRYYRDFAALSDVSFEVKRGETVGIIGRNGSGKSTLLQIICGTLQPTRGTVEVKGRIAALLELGAGFNPEFTGRENVYLNAAILGLSRAEVDERFDDIARFADIGAFIDQPVKTYSSGMYVRLAFATAINVEPDILVVDEALAVGDEAFQRKCYARIEQIKERGGTILFVSHGAQTIVQLCTRAMLFDRGELLLEGQPKTVVGQYQRLANASPAATREILAAIAALRHAPPVEPTPEKARDAPNSTQMKASPPAQASDNSVAVGSLAGYYDPGLTSKSRVEYPADGASIRNVRITAPDLGTVNLLEARERYAVTYDAHFSARVEAPLFGMQIKSLTGHVLAGANNALSKVTSNLIATPGSTLKVRFDFVCRLLPGTYALDVGVMRSRDGSGHFLHRIADVLLFRVLPLTDSLGVHYCDLETSLSVHPAINTIQPASTEPPNDQTCRQLDQS